jgi:hypothetical protein
MSYFLNRHFEKIKNEGWRSDELISREATVYGLLCWQFPNIDPLAIFRTLNESPEESWHDDELAAVIRRQDFLAIHCYTQELEELPTQDLFAFYRQESKARNIEIEEDPASLDQNRGWFFDQPDAQVDFEYWSKAEYWTSDEAVAISFGKNPKVVTGEALKNYLGKAQFADNYFSRCDLLDRAIQSDRLPKEIPPADFLAWTHQRSIPIPSALTDYLSAIKDTSSQSSAKPLSDTGRDSLLKLVLGMSIDSYGYKVGETRNPATGENRGSIAAALERLDLKLTPDTIRKYLKEAEQRFGDPLKNLRKD